MNEKPLNILLADDDESDRLLFKEAFEELKARTNVKTVNSGMQLLKLLDKTEEKTCRIFYFWISICQRKMAWNA